MIFFMTSGYKSYSLISCSLIPAFSLVLFWILILGLHKKTEQNANKQTAGKVEIENKHIFNVTTTTTSVVFHVQSLKSTNTLFIVCYHT